MLHHDKTPNTHAVILNEKKKNQLCKNKIKLNFPEKKIRDASIFYSNEKSYICVWYS